MFDVHETQPTTSQDQASFVNNQPAPFVMTGGYVGKVLRINSSLNDQDGKVPNEGKDESKDVEKLYPELPKLDLDFVRNDEAQLEPSAPTEEQLSYFAAISETGTTEGNTVDHEQFKVYTDSDSFAGKIHHRTVTFATSVEQREIPPDDSEDQTYLKEIPAAKLAQDTEDSEFNAYNMQLAGNVLSEDQSLFEKLGPKKNVPDQKAEVTEKAEEFNSYTLMTEKQSSNDVEKESNIIRNQAKENHSETVNTYQVLSETMEQEKHSHAFKSPTTKTSTQEESEPFNGHQLQSDRDNNEETQTGKSQTTVDDKQEFNAYNLLLNQKDDSKPQRDENVVLQNETRSINAMSQIDNIAVDPKKSEDSERVEPTTFNAHDFLCMQNEQAGESNSLVDTKPSDEIENFNAYKLLSTTAPKEEHLPQAQVFNAYEHLQSATNANQVVPGNNEKKEAQENTPSVSGSLNAFSLLKSSSKNTADTTQSSKSYEGSRSDDFNAYGLLENSDKENESLKGEEFNVCVPPTSSAKNDKNKASKNDKNETQDQSHVENPVNFNAYNFMKKTCKDEPIQANDSTDKSVLFISDNGNDNESTTNEHLPVKRVSFSHDIEQIKDEVEEQLSFSGLVPNAHTLEPSSSQYTEPLMSESPLQKESVNIYENLEKEKLSTFTSEGNQPSMSITESSLVVTNKDKHDALRSEDLDEQVAILNKAGDQV